jgi:acyl-CoA synthetase (AMP-forming)/AMP-acid ligase II
MSPAHVNRLTEELPNVQVFIMYGQTEATARISYLPPERVKEKIGSAGIPIPGVKIEIRDEKNHVVGPRAPGEIFVYGENIMQGYWKDPELTKKVLVNGWLKTGDLAYLDDEGYIFIQGRSSDMIKSGAHRISPREIEETISELPSIAEVCVVGISDEILGEVIKAVIVPVKNNNVDRITILKHCRDRLPQYKIPKIVDFIEELPKTPSGKIKRFLLAEQK